MDGRTNAINEAKIFVSDLEKIGIKSNKVILFGSYALGNQTEFSDIDLAIWSEQFTGIRMLDYEMLGSFLGEHTSIELHPFTNDDTAENDPFVAEIFNNGISIS